MGFLRIMLGLWMGWFAVRLVSGLVFRQLAAKTSEPQVDETKPAMLELIACPYCGVFTTPPCTNPECPGRNRG